jgi:hypothetical protein
MSINREDPFALADQQYRADVIRLKCRRYVTDEAWITAVNLESFRDRVIGQTVLEATVGGLKRLVADRVTRREQQKVYYKVPSRWWDALFHELAGWMVCGRYPLRFLLRWYREKEMMTYFDVPAEIQEHYHVCPAPPEALKYPTWGWHAYYLQQKEPFALRESYEMLCSMARCVANEEWLNASYWHHRWVREHTQ